MPDWELKFIYCKTKNSRSLLIYLVLAILKKVQSLTESDKWGAGCQLPHPSSPSPAPPPAPPSQQPSLVLTLGRVQSQRRRRGPDTRCGYSRHVSRLKRTHYLTDGARKVFLPRDQDRAQQQAPAAVFPEPSLQTQPLSSHFPWC